MPRRFLNYNERLKLINCVQQEGLNTAQSVFKVDKRTILRAIQNEAKINEKVNEGKGKMKRVVDQTKKLDSALLSFISEMNEKGYPLSSQMLCQKAVELSRDKSFKASKGWFHRFKQRCNVKFGNLSGESAGIDMSVVDKYKAEILPLIKTKYPPERRFNVDETSIFYRQLPSKSFYIKNGKHFGNKINKERITILLGCSQTGEKLPPLIITKSKNPRSIRGRTNEIAQQGILLESNKAAWMVKNIFFNYIQTWHNNLKKNGTKVALILDNFAGHKIDEKSFPLIEFFWLPPNTTCYLQPLDSGVIKSFKSKFVKKLLLKILDGFEKNLDFKQITKTITLYEAIEWLAYSWSELSTETIMNCWKKSGYEDEFVDEMVIDGNDENGENDQNNLIDENDENEVQQIYDQIPIYAKEKPTLVRYMQELTLNDKQTYLYDGASTSRGL